MVKAIKFWGLCLTYAWRGSFSLANAWQGLWGTLLLWAFGYWRKIPVTIPDKVDGYALSILFASLAVTWLGVFLLQFAIAPAKLYWAERNKVDDFELKSRAANSGVPDWPIDDLFCHIDPGVLDRSAEGEPYQTVANKLKDAFALDQLKIWGREVDDTGLGKMLGEIKPLTLIAPSYWNSAHFTFNFFDSTANGQPHTYVDKGCGLPEYTDLQVNRAEAISKWPSDSAERQFQLEIAENYANVRVADNPSIHDDILRGSDRQKFLGLLSAGILTAWARPMRGRSDFVRIPQTFWETHFIDVKLNSGQSIDTDGIRTDHHQSFLKTKNRNEPTHYDVCLNRTQMSKVWSDVSFTLDDGSGA